MTLLDRHLAAQFLTGFVKTLVTLVLLYIFIDFLTARRADMVENEVPLGVILQYYANYSPQLIYRMSPLAVLLAGLLVFGTAAQHREIIAALAGGISMHRLVCVPVLLAALIALGVYTADTVFGAGATQTAQQLRLKYFERNPDSRRAGVSWPNLEGGWTAHVIKYNRIANTGEDVFIHAIREDAVEQIQARRIYWDPEFEGEAGAWLLEDGVWVVFEPGASAVRESRRITQTEAPFDDSPEELFALEARPETKPSAALARDIERAEARGLPASQFWTNWHAKFAVPALNFVMIWLAIPFAMRVRRGGLAIGFGLSLVIGVSYLGLFAVTMALGNAGRLEPALAAWLPNALFFLVGMVLYSRTPT